MKFIFAGSLIAGTVATIAANILCTVVRSARAFDDQLEVFPAHGEVTHLVDVMSSNKPFRMESIWKGYDRPVIADDIGMELLLWGKVSLALLD